MRGIRGPVPGLGIVMVALAGAAMSGCMGWESAKFKRDIETSFILPAGHGIDVQTRNGAITLGEVERNDVLVKATVKATTQERADAVQITGEAIAGDLQIRALWPDQRKGSEGVTFVIEAPGGRPVRTVSTNGAISITGFEGGVFADTSNGAIWIDSHNGPLELESSNGAITVVGATGLVGADTSNGAIVVSLADGASGPVELDTSNGSVTLEVGREFGGVIDAETSNGRISTLDEAGVTSVSGSKRDKTIQIGEGDTRSRIDTSNGAVQVKVRS